MNEVNQAANVADDATKVETQVETTDTQSVDAVEPQVNDRLLQESQKWKAKAREYQKEIEARQKAELEVEGKAKERATYYQTRYEELRGTVVKQQLEAKVREYALQHGCVDPDAIIKLGDLEKLDYDENSGDITGAEMLVDEVLKTRPYLFNKEKPVINASVPGGAQKVSTATNADYSRMSASDIKAELSKVAKQLSTRR